MSIDKLTYKLIKKDTDSGGQKSDIQKRYHISERTYYRIRNSDDYEGYKKTMSGLKRGALKDSAEDETEKLAKALDKIKRKYEPRLMYNSSRLMAKYDCLIKDYVELQYKLKVYRNVMVYSIIVALVLVLVTIIVVSAVIYNVQNY